jgi:hypothetical protein
MPRSPSPEPEIAGPALPPGWKPPYKEEPQIEGPPLPNTTGIFITIFAITGEVKME